MSKPTDLVQGTLDLLILKTIALEPMHGWAIAQRIRQVSSRRALPRAPPLGTTELDHRRVGRVRE